MSRVRVELNLPLAEALLVLKLLDAASDKGDPVAKSAAKKVWLHLLDAGFSTGPKARSER